MFRNILHSPALWLGVLVLNAYSYFKSDDVLMVILEKAFAQSKAVSTGEQK